MIFMKAQDKTVGKREANLKKLEHYDLGGSYLFTYIDSDFPHARDIDDYGSGRMPLEALYKANIVFGKMGDGISESIVPISITFNPFEMKNKDMFRGIISDGERPIPQGMDGIYISKDFGDSGADGNSYIGYKMNDGVGIRMPSSSQMNAQKMQLGEEYVALINTLKKNRVLEAFENPPHNMTRLQEEQMTATINDLTQWLIDQSLIKMQEALEEESESSQNLSKQDSQNFTHMTFETAISAVANSSEGQMKMFEANISLQKQNLYAEAEACKRFQEAADARGIDMHGVTKEDLDWFVRGYHALAYYKKNAKDLLPIVEEYTGVKGEKAIKKYMDEFLPHINKKFDQGMDFSKVEASVRNLRARSVATPEVKAHMATRAADIKIQLDYIDRVERMIATKKKALSSYFSITNGDLDFLKGTTHLDYGELLKNINRLSQNMEATRDLIGQTTDQEEKAELKNKLAQRAEVMEILTSLKEIHPENEDIKLSRGGLSTINLVAQKDRRMFTAKENATIDEFNAKLESGAAKIASFDDVLKLSTTKLGKDLKPIIENYRVKYFKDNIDEDAALDGPTIERLKSAGAFATYRFDESTHKIESIDLLEKHIKELEKNALLTNKEINEQATRRCFEELSDPQQLAIRIQQMRIAMRALRADKGTEFDQYSDPEYQKLSSSLNVLQDAYSRWEKSHMLSQKIVADKDALREDIRKHINESAEEAKESADKKVIRTEPSQKLMEGIDRLKNYTDEEKKNIKEIIQSEFTRYNVPKDGQNILFDKIKNMDEHGRKIDPQEANIWKALCVACSQQSLEKLGGKMNDNITVKETIQKSEYSFMVIAAANPDMDVKKLADLQIKMNGLYDNARIAATNKENGFLGFLKNSQYSKLTPEQEAAIKDILGVDIKLTVGDRLFGDKEIRALLEDRTQAYETKLCEVLQYATAEQIDKIVGDNKLCSYDDLVKLAEEQINNGQKNYLLEMRGQIGKNEDIKAALEVFSKKVEQIPEFSFRGTRLAALRDEATTFFKHERNQAEQEKDAARQAIITDAEEQINKIFATQATSVFTNNEADAVKGEMLVFQERLNKQEIKSEDVKQVLEEETEPSDYHFLEGILSSLETDINNSDAVKVFNESIKNFILMQEEDSEIKAETYITIGNVAYITRHDIAGKLSDKDIEENRDELTKRAIYLLDYYKTLEETGKGEIIEAIKDRKERVEENLYKLDSEEAAKLNITSEVIAERKAKGTSAASAGEEKQKGKTSPEQQNETEEGNSI